MATMKKDMAFAVLDNHVICMLKMLNLNIKCLKESRVYP